VRTDVHTANPMGSYVAIAGIVLFNLAVFLDWFSTEDGETYSGYEADSLVPFIAYLGVGLAISLLYAQRRALRGQHRGLTLTAMAVGIAAFLQTVAAALDVPGSMERGFDLGSELGVYAAMIGAAVWSVGAGLLAKEPEGDPERDSVVSQSGDRSVV
jgi:hypothetical protein